MILPLYQSLLFQLGQMLIIEFIRKRDERLIPKEADIL